MITQNWDIFKIHCLLKVNLFLVCISMPATKVNGSCCTCQKYLGWELKRNIHFKNMYDKNLNKIIKVYKKGYILSCLKYKYYVFIGLTLLMSN